MDTNVLVSALLFKGEMSVIHTLWKKGLLKPLISRQIYEEIGRVLFYPKFKLSRKEIEAIFTEEILPFFDTVEPNKEIHGVCRDSDDDKFLSCAISGRAGFIISGDNDLLALRRYLSVAIITPADFIKRLKKNKIFQK